MRFSRIGFMLWFLFLCTVSCMFLAPVPKARSACCYFTAKEQDLEQPSQKVFLTWDPKKQIETFTVQPRFEGDAKDFGMVIPTPTQPRIDPMPRDFFRSLSVATILFSRAKPQSNLLYHPGMGFGGGFGGFGGFGKYGGGFGGGLAGIGGFGGGMGGFVRPRPAAIKELEAGLVGNLEYKIIKAGRADDLYEWLKQHRYHYKGDEATLDYYIKKKWLFTIMKIDTTQMKRDAKGKYLGEITPTRFRFRSKQFVYPLKITQISVKKKTTALFYVQAPYKVDLEGPFSYQFTWLPTLAGAVRSNGPGVLPRGGRAWLTVAKQQYPRMKAMAKELGYSLQPGSRPEPNKKGLSPATLEWAKRLSMMDIRRFRGMALYSETVPDPDAGFTLQDMTHPFRGPQARRTIQARLQQYRQQRPRGYLVRDAPREDRLMMRLLAGHLHKGQFLTKFRKVFTPTEMDEDLLLVPAETQNVPDTSEYIETLPSSPP